MPGPMLPRVSNEELMMADEDVLTELTSDGVLIVTLNRPEMMNALGGGIPAGIQDAAARANRDDDVRAIVFTGAGRGFCAGADLSGGGPARGGAGLRASPPPSSVRSPSSPRPPQPKACEPSPGQARTRPNRRRRTPSLGSDNNNDRNKENGGFVYEDKKTKLCSGV